MFHHRLPSAVFTQEIRWYPSEEILQRRHLLNAGKALGLSENTSVRQPDRMKTALLPEADDLLSAIEAELARDAADSTTPEEAKRYLAGDLIVLRAMRHIVFADTARQLAG